MNARFLFVTLLSVTLLFLLAPAFLKVKSGPTSAKAINNAKQIGIAITEFEAQYGHFPQPDQHEDFIEDYPVQRRTDSNYLFGQLLVSKVLDSEKVFFWGRGAKEGDDKFSSPENNLEAGENQFSYISKAGGRSLNSKDFPAETPIVLAPMIAGTELFDPNYIDWSRRMVFLKIDSSVATSDIEPNGKVIIDKERQLGLLDTGEETVWGDGPLTIHHPLGYPRAPNLDFLRKQELWQNTKNVLYALFILVVIGAFSTPVIRKFKTLSAR